MKRVGPLSAAKLAGVVYALGGLLAGGLISLVSIVGAGIGLSQGDGQFPGMLFGAGAIIILPVCYGALGFITTLIGAWLYNVVAGMVGGVEIELQQGAGPS